MRESEIIELIQLVLGQQVQMLQWWASMSFALVALAHFGKKNLNLTIVITVSILYVGFTLFVLGVLLDLNSKAAVLTNDLSVVSGSENRSNTSAYLISDFVQLPSGDIVRKMVSSPLYQAALILVMFGTFVTPLFLVISTYIRNRKPRRLRSDVPTNERPDS